jgi:hypothetical protein
VNTHEQRLVERLRATISDRDEEIAELRRKLGERPEREPIAGISTEALWRGRLESTVLRAVAEEFGVTPKELAKPNKSRAAGMRRHIAMYLMMRAGLSTTQTATAMGCRNHTTAVYAGQRVADAMATSPLVREAIARLEAVCPCASGGIN